MSELRVPSSNIWLGATAHLYTVSGMSHLSNVVINEAMGTAPPSLDGELPSTTYRYVTTTGDLLDAALPTDPGVINIAIDIVGFGSTTGDYGSWKSYWVISSADGTAWIMAPGCGEDVGGGVYSGVGGFYTYDGSQSGPSMTGTVDGANFRVEVTDAPSLNDYTVTLTINRAF